MEGNRLAGTGTGTGKIFTVKLSFFAFNLEQITPAEKNYARNKCEVCLKLQVLSQLYL